MAASWNRFSATDTAICFSSVSMRHSMSRRVWSFNNGLFSASFGCVPTTASFRLDFSGVSNGLFSASFGCGVAAWIPSPWIPSPWMPLRAFRGGASSCECWSFNSRWDLPSFVMPSTLPSFVSPSTLPSFVMASSMLWFLLFASFFSDDSLFCASWSLCWAFSSSTALSSPSITTSSSTSGTSISLSSSFVSASSSSLSCALSTSSLSALWFFWSLPSASSSSTIPNTGVPVASSSPAPLELASSFASAIAMLTDDVASQSNSLPPRCLRRVSVKWRVTCSNSDARTSWSYHWALTTRSKNDVGLVTCHNFRERI